MTESNIPNGQAQCPLAPALCSASAATGKWVPAESTLQIIRDPRWLWVRNPDCKYIKLWVDTRDGHCIISDRNGKEITLRELSRQGDEYLTPNEKS
jgi:hypothetical protein